MNSIRCNFHCYRYPQHAAAVANCCLLKTVFAEVAICFLDGIALQERNLIADVKEPAWILIEHVIVADKFINCPNWRPVRKLCVRAVEQVFPCLDVD